MTAPRHPTFLDDDPWYIEAWDRAGEPEHGYEPALTFAPPRDGSCPVCGRESTDGWECHRCQRDGLW